MWNSFVDLLDFIYLLLYLYLLNSLVVCYEYHYFGKWPCDYYHWLRTSLLFAMAGYMTALASSRWTCYSPGKRPIFKSPVNNLECTYICLQYYTLQVSCHGRERWCLRRTHGRDKALLLLWPRSLWLQGFQTSQRRGLFFQDSCVWLHGRLDR